MIDRDVKQAEWYRDANASRLFHHLAYSVFYVDGSIYKQGQCRFSVAEMSSDLSLTGKQIRTAIEKLERYGVIKTETASKKSIGTLFTILKYVNFAKNEKANGVANERANAFEFQSNQNQSLTSQFGKTMANEKANGVANERANQYENNTNKNINKICCYSDDFEKKLFDGLRRYDTQWKEQRCRMLHLTLEAFMDYIDKFEQVCQKNQSWHNYTNNVASDVSSLVKHFNQWIEKELNPKPKQQGYGTTGATNGFTGRGAYEPSKNATYEGGFGD